MTSNPTSPHGLTDVVADFASALKYDDLPADIVRETKRLLLDTIGCGIGGLQLEKGRMAVDLVRLGGGTAEASIVGVRGKLPCAAAAFANGELMNAIDWNALLPPSHVPPYVIPPALALAEARHASGKDLICAVAAALEVSGRVGTSLGGLRATPGGFPLRVWGISSNQLGATVGAAKILKLSDERMLHAVGLAGYYAPVPSHVKYNHTTHVGYAKYAPSGWIAQAGVTTALLAQMGYRGDTSVLDGEHGFWVMNGAPSCDADKVTDQLGRQWVFMNAAYKYWPTCGMFQSPLDAFTKIIADHDLQPDEIEEVVVKIEAFAGLEKYVNVDIRDHVEAASSLPFVIAVAAHRIKRGPGWQATEVIDDPRIRAFMRKVKHAVNPRSEQLRKQDLEIEGKPYLSHRPADVEVRARGTVFSQSVDFAQWLSIGVDAYRPTDEGLAEKFRANAEGVLDERKTSGAIEAILNLEKSTDVAGVVAMLVP
jgi:2-methylcitrate dehydratase PrpD